MTPTTRAATTTAAPHPLIGSILDTVWEEEPRSVQQYYLDGEPTGLFSGARLPIEWDEEGDGPVVWLGFAERSGTGDRGVFATEIDATVLVLELAGHQGVWERFRVADAMDVSIAAGTGTIGTTCFEDGDVRYAAELAFTPGGPEIARLWHIDLTSLTLVEIAPDAVPCPDPGSAPAADGAVGRIVTIAGGCADDSDACGHVLDLSAAQPELLPWWEHGGSVLDSWGFALRRSVAVVGAVRSVDEPQSRHAWLEEFLAWDLGGDSMWRVLDEVVLPDTGAAETQCWSTTGAPAIGVAGPDDAPGEVSVAWVVELSTEQLVPTDPADVRCEVVGD